MKRTPLQRKTPLRAKGGAIRRAPIKVKRKTAASADEKRHMERIVALGCLVCRCPATIHHVTAGIEGGRITRSHRRTVPLCPEHHQIQHGPRESVEALGHGGFYRAHGIDLLAEADRLWRASEALSS